jgi:hypothetical protein
MRTRTNSGTGEDVVLELARQTHTSLEQARTSYEAELVNLERGAKVTMYVPVFAMRAARERLMKGH